MSKLASNNNKAFGPFTQPITSPSLGYYDRGTKLYYPLIKPTGSLTVSGYVYSYDRSVGDTFGIGLSGTKYVVPNKRVTAVTYDIPAGTYTPSAFENLIRSFISNNGSRAVKNSFSVEVNGQTYRVSASSSIYYTYQYSGQARFVCFNGSNRGCISFEQPGSFAQYGIYCTYWTASQQQGDRYYMYSIKLNGGINFK